jgi:hypothetical protein
MTEPTHYDVLGVPRTADRETIRKAYIAIARSSHPDRHSPSTGQRHNADDRIRAANAAWNELRDPERRQEYDLSLPDPQTRVAPRPTRPNLSDDRPPPPSGIVVSAHTAPLWKWGPIVVAVAIGAALIIGSAYATSQDNSTSAVSVPSSAPRYQPGSCVLIVGGPSGKIAQAVDCDRQFASVIDSVVDSPRPCPPSTATIPLYDGKTTLCLRSP